MRSGCALLFASIGGFAPSWVVRRPTSAVATATATPATTPLATRGCGPAPDSLSMPDRVSESRKPSAKRKEGATIGLSAVNIHPARGAGRFLHGRALRRSARFHGLPAKRLYERHC
nr:MAG TPA: hypothetical protein [Caudoviricetes sp.]